MGKRELALAVIEQLHNGEWEYQWNRISESALTAYRNGKRLWCGNGGFFTDIDGSNCFGFFWRHVVWWLGVRPTKKRFEEEFKKKVRQSLSRQHELHT